MTVSKTQYLSKNDYPFGSAISARGWSDVNRQYRYGFIGKEKDIVGMCGGGSTNDCGFRIYYSSICKFLSVDPLCKSYPWCTPYQFAGNKPIWTIDIVGLEGYYTNDGSFIGKYETRSEIHIVKASEVEIAIT